jgi:hypothetical protein
MADDSHYALPVEAAPRDGTTLMLLVDYSAEEADHPLEDTAGLAWTIGHNNFDNDEEDVWKFAGWCWTHDHYTQGRGRVIGWLPLRGPLPPALNDIALERRRQVDEEGWTAEHDDSHGLGQMALGAAAYAVWASFTLDPIQALGDIALKLWPWSSGWWKPKGPRRDLVRAGALIVAEIERLDRATVHAATEQKGG